jgi:hypothetical protein
MCCLYLSFARLIFASSGASLPDLRLTRPDELDSAFKAERGPTPNAGQGATFQVFRRLWKRPVSMIDSVYRRR